MADEKWMFLADAANFIGKKDVPRRIKWAGMRGVRVGESTLVEIPASEVAGLRIDWVCSSLMLGRLGTMYQSVQMRWADVKRLAQEDVHRLAQEVSEATTSIAPPPRQAPQAASKAAHAQHLSPAEIGRTGGKKSGESRRAARKWVAHAFELANVACSRNSAASHAGIARKIVDNWKLPRVAHPVRETLSRWVSQQRAEGKLPPRTASRATRSGSGG